MKKSICVILSVIMVMSLLPFNMLTASASIDIKYQISRGATHSLVVKEDGTLCGWGDNGEGALSNAISEYKTNIPTVIANDVKAVSAGGEYSLVIKNDDSLWSWGFNNTGTLGIGSPYIEERYTPTKVMDDVNYVFAGQTHAMAIKTDSTLWTWGNNYFGQLGSGDKRNSSIPIKMMNDVLFACAGNDHTAAINNQNTLLMWGYNAYGQLGDGTTSNSILPKEIMQNVRDISLGHSHSAAIKTDGSLWTWGRNSYGQLGNGTTVDSATPIKVMDDVIQVCLQGGCSFALKNDGTLWAWGDNSAGELGNNSTQNTSIPTKIMDDVICINRCMAITEDYSLWTWGSNWDGALGNGSNIEKSLVPIKIMNLISGMKSENNYTYSGIFDYRIDDDGNAIITKIIESDESGSVSIPTEIDGYKVVAIDEYCIPDSANIKRITIPCTITHIDENAFNGYDGIEIIYYFSTEDDWIEITDGIHYISDDTELVYVMDDVENAEISAYNKPEKKKDNNVNFTNAIRDWEKEKNDWIDTLVKVVNNIKDDISVSNEDAINSNYEKNKERIDAMIADEGWYQSGSDSARDAAFRAVYDMIADWGEESISLDKVDPSSDVVDFSTRVVKNVINGMKNQTIEKDYGDYTVLITVSGISTGLFENPAFTGSVTVKHKNGKTFGPALINSTVDDTKQVMSDYMLQLKELEENTIEMAMEIYVSDLISLTNSKLPLDAIKEKLDSASEIINDTLEEKGLGNLNNFIGGVIDVIKSTKEVIELQNGGDTDALIRAVADLDSKLDFLSGESTTATSATLDWAYKNLKQKTKYLKEVTEAYIDGKEIPEYETTLDKIVGWFDKHIFQCPVDVYVYNGNDELIGCVSNEQIFSDTEEIYVEKNGDTKTVYVAEGANVHFKLVGTDIGNLDYVAETYSENKVVGRTNFYGIELYDGKEITAETTDETASNNCNEIIIQSDGETINTTEYLKATDNASVLIESNVVGSGTVVGTGWYARGDSVTLVATPNEGYVFKGWYDGDTPIAFNANYTFCAKDFVEVTAKFEKYEENYLVSIPVSESFKNIYDISADSDEDNVYVYVKELSEEADVSKLNLYLAEYETSGKLSTLKIADIKVDSNGTMIFTIPYPQLEDFKIMLWTNNITPVIDVLN